MADDMEDVTQRFTAETEEYVAELETAARDARDFADANTEAKLAVDGMRDATVEAAPAVGHVRDEIAEAAAALKIYRDEAGKLRDSAGEVITASEAEARALKHIRDQALEAAWAVRELKSQDKSMAKDGLLSSLFMALEGKGGQGLTSGLPMSGMLGLPALLAIIPAVEAGLVELTGLVSGFAAAGAGAGAFALLAMPAFKAVSGAYTQIQADQTAYNRALTAAAKSTALKHLKEDYAALDPAQRAAVRGVQGLVGEYHKLSRAFEPQAFKVFNDVLKIANQLLPDITPFATTFASAVGGLLQRVGTFAGSAGFKDWLQQFHKLEGPAITAIGNGIGQVAGSIGKLLTTMSAKDDVNAINIAFGILSGTINVLTYMVHRLMTNWDEMSGAFRRVRHDIAADAHEIAHVFDDLRHDIATGAHDIANWFDQDRHAVATMAHDFAAHFDEIRHDIAHWADDVRHDVDRVVAWFQALPGRVLHWLAALPGQLVSAGASIIGGLITGIENAVPGLHSALSWVSGLIPSWKGPIEKDAQMLVPHGMVIMQGLMRGIASQLPALRAQLAGVTGSIPASIGTHGIGGVVGAGAGGYGGGSSHMTVNVAASLAPGMQAYQTPAFQQYLQTVVQEAFARWGLNNPGTGFGIPGRG